MSRMALSGVKSQNETTVERSRSAAAVVGEFDDDFDHYDSTRFVRRHLALSPAELAREYREAYPADAMYVRPEVTGAVIGLLVGGLAWALTRRSHP